MYCNYGLHERGRACILDLIERMTLVIYILAQTVFGLLRNARLFGLALAGVMDLSHTAKVLTYLTLSYKLWKKKTNDKHVSNDFHNAHGRPVMARADCHSQVRSSLQKIGLRHTQVIAATPHVATGHI